MKEKLLMLTLLLGLHTPIGIGSRAAEHEFRTDINPALLYFQAYQAMPRLSEADENHLFDHRFAWPSEPFDDRAMALMQQYDTSLKLIRRARFSKVPCDWGYDLSDGPEALLPGLAPAKRISQVTRLRSMAALDANDFASMREDFAAAFALARNLSKDRVLISALVQIAMENILTSMIMENYYRLSADQLDQLVAAIDAAPRRGTIADTISVEHHSFYGYVRGKVQTMIDETGGDNEQFWARFEPFWNRIATEVDSKTGPEPSAAEIQQEAGGTTAGVVRLLDELPGFYTETRRIMTLPYPEYQEQFPTFWAQISDSGNPFTKQFFTLFRTIRAKEFSAIVREEMVRAAAAYKRAGMNGLRAVQDPLAGGMFEFTRVQFEGVDRGFRLRSNEQFRDFDEVMIFLEKPGKHFRLDGINAGTGW